MTVSNNTYKKHREFDMNKMIRVVHRQEDAVRRRNVSISDRPLFDAICAELNYRRDNSGCGGRILTKRDLEEVSEEKTIPDPFKELRAASATDCVCWASTRHRVKLTENDEGWYFPLIPRVYQPSEKFGESFQRQFMEFYPAPPARHPEMERALNLSVNIRERPLMEEPQFLCEFRFPE